MQLESDRLEYDSARLLIYDMIEKASAGISDIDMLIAAFKLAANERKGPLHRVVNDLQKTLHRLKNGEESSASILQTLSFSPLISEIIENPTKGLK